MPGALIRVLACARLPNDDCDGFRPCCGAAFRACAVSRARGRTRARVAGSLGASPLRRIRTRSRHNRSRARRHKRIRFRGTSRHDRKPRAETHRGLREAKRHNSVEPLEQVPLYLTEHDVAELLTPADAVEAIEACFRRLAAGSVENRPRYRLGLEEGALAVMAAAHLQLGYARAEGYAGFWGGGRLVRVPFRPG